MMDIIHAGNNSVDYSSTDWNCSLHMLQQEEVLPQVELHSSQDIHTTHVKAGINTQAIHNKGDIHPDVDIEVDDIILKDEHNLEEVKLDCR